MIAPLREASKHLPPLPEVGPEDPGPFSFADESKSKIGIGEAAGTPMLRWTISPGLGTNSGQISPTHVPYSKVFRSHAAFCMGAMYLQVS
jgi:hypothetical protein